LLRISNFLSQIGIISLVCIPRLGVAECVWQMRTVDETNGAACKYTYSS
jgi:hypothetical protein